MTEDLQHESVSQLFDGNTIAPQFAIALKDFMAKNLGIRVEKGVTSVTTSGSGTGKIAHGLGITPNMYSVSSGFYQLISHTILIDFVGYVSLCSKKTFRTT